MGRRGVARSRVVKPPGDVLRLNEEQEVLGEGNFSVVKRFTADGSENEYAGKIISRREVPPSGFWRIESEEGILELLDHRNVVKFYAAILYGPRGPLLVLELLNRGELYQYVIKYQSDFHCEGDVMNYMRDIFSGLEYCHKKDIIHRDLQPPNLCVHYVAGAGVVVKLIDFGLAVYTNGIDRYRHGLCGAPGYRAPDMTRGERYGTPVDLFACGCILFNLLFGCHPYVNSTCDNFLFPEPNEDGISRPAKDLIVKMLIHNQELRYTATQALGHSFFVGSKRDALHTHQPLTVAFARLTEFTEKKMWETVASVGEFGYVPGASAKIRRRLVPTNVSEARDTIDCGMSQKSDFVRSRY